MRPASSTRTFAGRRPARASRASASARPIWFFWIPIRPGSSRAISSAPSPQRARAAAPLVLARRVELVEVDEVVQHLDLVRPHPGERRPARAAPPRSWRSPDRCCFDRCHSVSRCNRLIARLRTAVTTTGTGARRAARRAQKFALSRYECRMSGRSCSSTSTRRARPLPAHARDAQHVARLPGGQVVAVVNDVLVDAQGGLEARRQLRHQLEDLPLGPPLLQVGDEQQHLVPPQRESRRQTARRRSPVPPPGAPPPRARAPPGRSTSSQPWPLMSRQCGGCPASARRPSTRSTWIARPSAASAASAAAQ